MLSIRQFFFWETLHQFIPVKNLEWFLILFFQKPYSAKMNVHVHVSNICPLM